MPPILPLSQLINVCLPYHNRAIYLAAHLSVSAQAGHKVLDITSSDPSH